MNYLAKSLIQNIFSRLPNKLGTYLYRRLQNRYSFKFNEVNEKAKFYKAYNSVLLSNVSGEDFNEKRLLEIGTGFCPTASLCFWMLGFDSVFSIDLNRNINKKLFDSFLDWLKKNKNEILSLRGFNEKRINFLLDLKKLNFEDKISILRKNGFFYKAPLNLLDAKFDYRYFDYIYSYDVLEHVSPKEIEIIFSESKKILKYSGLMIHRINFADHFSKTDKNISRINFLKFNKFQFNLLAGNKYMYMNRLRECDFLKIFNDLQLLIVRKESKVDPNIKNQLLENKIKIHSDFIHKDIDSLATLSSEFFLMLNPDQQIDCKKTKITYKILSQLIEDLKIKKDSRFLDIGCGNGNLTYFFNQNKKNCIGIDVQFKKGLYKKTLLEKNIIRRIECGGKLKKDLETINTIYEWPIETGIIDFSFSIDVLEHINNIEEFVKENARVINPGGYSVHYFPSRFSILEAHTGIPFGGYFVNKSYYWLMIKLGLSSKKFKNSTKAFQYVTRATNYMSKRNLINLFKKNNFSFVCERNDLTIRFKGSKIMKYLFRVKIFRKLFGIFRSKLIIFRKF